MGKGEGSLPLDPQGCPTPPQMAEKGCPINRGLSGYNMESLTMDYSW